jgi:nucleoid-associated protein YgaU
MPSGPLRRLFPGLLGLVIIGAVVAWFGIVKPQRQGESASSPSQTLRPQNEASTHSHSGPTAALEGQASVPPPLKPAEAGGDQAGAPAPVSPVQPNTPAVAEADKPSGPSFDIVRVEPNGETVMAGRGAPGATIEMSRNGKSHARAVADMSGLFAFVPPPLRPGSHEISLSSIAPDGTRAQSRDSVTVVINEDQTTKPLVTLTSPDRPTVVLSAPEPAGQKPSDADSPQGGNSQVAAAAPGPSPPQPGAPQPRPGVKIGSVEAEEGGRLFVSGNAAAGATVRLYLNESFIAPGGAGGDGKVSFAIGRGVRPGNYRVRLDEVDPVSGQVKSRAEVAFNVPAPLTVPLPPQTEPHLPSPDLPGTAVAGASGPAGRPGLPGVPQTSRGTAAPEGSTGLRLAERSGTPGGPARSLDPGTILVPQVNTAMVARGDNLWRISRRIYGQGTRYTVIYDANQGQIRNPDRIYPGQLFVLPPEQAGAAR